MSSEMFRGKESSNGIELSRLVQDLLNFGVLGSPWLQGGGWGVGGGGWGVGGWGWGWLGGAPHTHAHAHACMHTHACTVMRGKHDNFMQMAACIGFLGNPWEIPMMSYACVCMHVHACVCICTCVGGTLSTPPTPSTHTPTPRGDPCNQ